jgi:hypothetical protein
MAFTTKAHLPLVSATQFDVAPVSVADETDYSGVVGAGTGDYIAYASMPKGRALLICVNTGAAASSPTGLTVGLLKATDANGGSAAFVSGTTTELEASSVSGDKQYQVEIPLSYVSDSAGYYSAGVALKGGGSSTCIIGTVSMVLDPTYA